MKRIRYRVVVLIIILCLLIPLISLDVLAVENETDKSNIEIASISLGGFHSAAITQNGDLYTWGNNSYGQLGDGTTTNRSIPIKIMENIASVSLGENHSAAVTNDGTLYTWGSNRFGELGDGTTESCSTPKKSWKT